MDEKRKHRAWTNDISEVAVFVATAIFSVVFAAYMAGLTGYGFQQTNQKMVNYTLNLITWKNANWPVNESIVSDNWPGLTPRNIQIFVLLHVLIFYVVKMFGILFEQVQTKPPMKGQARTFYDNSDKYQAAVADFTKN